ncbi:MAG: T9SS type A sorting domain-containing protein [Paludibacteraceae bacterium]|nr:T9SS type A sorting domain-containing protein [Paludibacteraceae bacterium]
MNLKQIILASACILTGMMSVSAEATYLTVELNAGNKYNFLLADKPVVTFKSGDLVVNGNSETSYSIEGVKNFHFTEGDVTKVEQLSSEEIRIVSLDEATIQLQNLDKQAVVTLMNVSGMLISSSKTNEDGTAIVSLPKTKGVYILSVAGKSFKIIRK